MKNLGKLSVLFIAAAMGVLGTGCQKSDGAVELYTELTEGTMAGIEESGQLAGGFDSEVTGAVLPEETQKAFDKAFEGYAGTKPMPLALLGTQVVAGTNHAVLCRTADGELSVCIIYADLSGNAEVTGTSEFDMNAIEEAEESAFSGELCGGWNVDADLFKGSENLASFPENAKNAYEKAMKDCPDEITFMPQAFLGSQIVAGTNYRVLCVVKDNSTDTEIVEVRLLKIYEDLEGNAEITSMSTVNAADYNK